MNREQTDSVIRRVKIERRIVRAAVKSALALGYTVSVHDGDDGWELKKCPKLNVIMAALFSMDQDDIFFHRDGKRLWLHPVYGNGGWDVLSDWSDCPEMDEILKEANALSDKFANSGQ